MSKRPKGAKKMVEPKAEKVEATSNEKGKKPVSDVIYIGKAEIKQYRKSLYLLGAVLKLSKFTIEARGKAISRAVDVANIAGRMLNTQSCGAKYFPVDVKIAEIMLPRQGEIPQGKSDKVPISTIIITMARDA